MGLALPLKYRPRKWDEVVGQDAVVKSLRKVIERDNAQTFLFTGPSGCGKTTLARIAARELGCGTKDIIEVDGAKYTGVEAMRELTDIISYRPFGDSERRAVILDECHRASKQAWDALLKATEEPPDHMLWFFCTTEPGKIPRTMMTRASTYKLRDVSEGQLARLVEEVTAEEKIKLASGVLDVIVKEARGSPRQALNFLEQCIDAKDRKEAAQLLHSAVNSEPVLELCRFIVKGGSWKAAMSLVKACEDESPESIRIQVSNYLGVAAREATSDNQAAALLSKLSAFDQPYNTSENQAPLILSLGRCLLS